MINLRAWRYLGSILLIATALSTDFAVASSGDFIADAVLGQATFTTSSSSDGTTGFNLAAGVAIDPNSNRIYVSDYSNNRVLGWASASAFASGQAADLVIGQADFTSILPNRGGVASSSTLSSPEGLSVDQYGNLFVADNGNNRVLVFTNPSAAGNIQADFVLGQPDFTTTTTGVTSSKYNAPTDVLVDKYDHVYVADSMNNRVLGLISPVFSDTVADKAWGQSDFISNGAGAGSTGLTQPFGLAVDLEGNLYVADLANSRVLQYDKGYAGDATADRVYGQPDFTINTAGTTSSKFSSAAAIAVDATGALYVADYNNNRLMVYDTPLAVTGSAGAASRVIGQANFTDSTLGTTASTFNRPFKLIFSNDRSLFIADSANHRLLRFDVPVADPYPSTQFSYTIPEVFRDASLSGPFPITVSGLAGTVNKVTVTLKGLTHSFPDDLDIFLVGPTGAAVKLMSDAGAGTDILYNALTFSDSAASALPDSTAITSGTYQPTDYNPSADGPVVLNLPTALSTFNGLNPNGEWSLFVVDDVNADVGGMTGWGLNIFTNPVITYAYANPSAAHIGDTVTFTALATSSPTDTVSYSWNFGDGSSGTGASATHAYSAAGSFTAVVTATTASGASTTQNVALTIGYALTDLKPVSITAKKVKGKLQCTFNVQNAGSFPASATTAEVRFGLASDSIGKLVKSISVPALSANTQSEKFTFSKAPGAFKYCRIVVDSNFVVSETNEANNASSKKTK